MPAKAMRLKAAGLDNTAGLAHHAWQSKALLPMALLRLEQFPIVRSELIKDHNFCAEFLAKLECALFAHDLACIAHAAAVAQCEGPRAHGFQLAQQRGERFFTGGARSGIRAVEVRLD